jgi:hypothetical protein
MGESFEDKYQALLTTIDGLNFNDGAYLKLCDALKMIKESCDKVSIKEINIYLDFQIQNKYYTIFVVQQELIKTDGRNIEYLNYSIKSDSRQFDFKKEESDAVEHIKRYLKHATNIKVFNKARHQFLSKIKIFSQMN